LIFGATLVFLIGITFETALNGFERQFSNLNHTIEQSRREVNNLLEQVTQIDVQIKQNQALNEVEIRKKLTESRDQLGRARQAEINELDKRQTDLQVPGVSGAQAQQMERDIQSIDRQIATLQQSRKDEIDRARAQQDSALKRADDVRKS
jgi:prefoldin subunit 5